MAKPETQEILAAIEEKATWVREGFPGTMPVNVGELLLFMSIALALVDTLEEAGELPETCALLRAHGAALLAEP